MEIQAERDDEGVGGVRNWKQPLQLTRSALWSSPTLQPTKSKWAFCRLLKIGRQ